MTHESTPRCRLAGMLLASALLAGCASTPKPLYQWADYQPTVYEHFKGQDAEQQVLAMEKNIQQAQAQGGALPPGYHAHLGLLYGKLGHHDQMIQQFQTEKDHFPEFAPYLNFLTNQATQ